ncbi:MAG TPA: hypothetical protein VGH13_04360 [Xanthobacteraceae bacterium]|jgi:hypothetical protein
MDDRHPKRPRSLRPRAAMLAVPLILVAALAEASEVTMICKNPRREYLVRFDETARTLNATSDGDASAYQVLTVEKSAKRLWVSGLTVNDGPTYRASFRPKMRMEYFAANKLIETDACR